MKIGFIGTGNMGSAMMGGIISSGIVDAQDVMASDIFQAALDRVNEQFGVHTSISNRDYPVVEAIIMGIAIIVIGLNLLVDIIYRIIDPRIRIED